MTALFALISVVVLVLFGVGCRGGEASSEVESPQLSPWELPMTDRPELLSNLVRAIVQEPGGAFWFGTSGGVSRYDPATRTWSTYTTRNGLVHNDVRAMVKEPGGALWFGTWGGVSRYDPKTRSWSTYTTKEGLAHNSVYAIAQESGGALWFGTWGGVSRYDPKTRSWSTYTTKEGLADSHVQAIVQESGGALWFGTGDGGVSRYDPKDRSWVSYSTKDGLADNSVWAIVQERSGALWFGTGGGVSRYDPKDRSWVNYSTKDGLADNSVWAILEDTHGALWFGTQGGVSRYDPKTRSWETYSTKNGLADDHVWAIFEDTGGAFWFGTWGGGVSRYDPKGGAWSTYTTKDGFADNAVWAIAQEPGGVLLFGTDGGVGRYDSKAQSWSTYTTKEGLADNHVRALAQETGGALWLGTIGGVSRYDPKTRAWSTYTVKDDLPSNSIYAIAEGADGALWFGTWGGGVSRYDPKAGSWSTYATKEGLVDNRSRGIAREAGGALWFGTTGGVSRYDPEGRSWSSYTTKDGLADDTVWAITREAGGALWFGTTGGASRYDPEGRSWSTYTTKDGLADNAVWSITQEAGGALWFGTTGGVSRYDPKARSWLTYTTRDGLADNNVQAIMQDPGGALWMGTSVGIMRMVLDGAAGEAGTLLSTGVHAPMRIAALPRALVMTRPSKGLSFITVDQPGHARLSTAPAFAGTNVTALAPGPAGGVWVGTDLGGLVLRKPGEDIRLTSTRGLPSATVTALAAVADSRNTSVWVGTSAGACRVLAEGNEIRVDYTVRWEGMPTGPVDALASGKDGSVVVAYNAIPAKRFLDPTLAERRARTRVFRLVPGGAQREILFSEPFAASTVRALAFSKKYGLWAATSTGLFLAKDEAGVSTGGNPRFEPVTGQGRLPPMPIRLLAITPDNSETVWMGVDRQGDTPPLVVGYRPGTGWVYTLSQARGIPEGDAIDDLSFTEDGDLVVLVDSQLAKGRVFVPIAPSAPATIWLVLLALGLTLTAVVGAAAVIIRRNVYLRTPVTELPFSALSATLRSMERFRVLNENWARLGLPKTRVSVIKTLTAAGPPGLQKLRVLAELLGMDKANAASTSILPYGIDILSTKLPYPAPFRDHPITLVAIDITEARKAEPARIREALKNGLDAAGQRFELPYLLLAGDDVTTDILPPDLGSLRLDERNTKALLFAKDPGHTLAGLLHARRLLALSPYATAGEVKDEQMFFGRVADLKETLLSPSIQQLIIGPRRVGKTSLLKRLLREIADRRPDAEPIFVDLYGIREHARATRALARAIKATPPEDADSDAAFADILRARFQDRNKKGIVLIDEADGLIEADANKGFPLLSAMRSLQAEDVCSFVLAGYLYLYRETLNQSSPLYNFATRRLLGPLDPEAASDLARVPMERLGVAYAEPSLPARIAAQTGGYPSFVQLLCDAALDVLRESGGGDLTLTRKHVDQAEARVASALGEIFVANAGKEAQLIVYSLLEQDTFVAADAEKALERVPETALRPPAWGEAARRALQELRLFGFCVEEDGRFTWAIPLLRRTLRAAEPEVLVKRLVDELSRAAGETPPRSVT